MVNKADFIIYERPKVEGARSTRSTGQPVPMTAGNWQKETLDVMGMYAPTEGRFSSVQGEQLTLFDMAPVSKTKELDLSGSSPTPSHWDSFQWFAKDSLRQVPIPGSHYAPKTAGASHATDAHSVTNGQLIVDGVTEIKEDNFPGRVSYTDGGLYPKGDKNDPKVIAQHRNAPNYRTMDGNKHVHGVGQPTKQGFKDVLNHIGKDKPIVWTNHRAEAVIYLNGEPHNLRELASRENLVLKDGASGKEIEALEDELKKRLIAKGSIEVASEEIGADGKPHRVMRKIEPLTIENTQTTKDVIDELKADGYKVEYKRIPIADEKAPSPAQLDEVRQWTNEMQAKHPQSDLDFVFNCHQGRGRTTTGMVTAGIGLEGKGVQLELPFVGNIGEGSERRADRIIDSTQHMQNLRETVNETKDSARKAEADQKRYESEAAAATDQKTKMELQAKADKAQADKEKYDARATDFTKRYVMMQKYSEYVDKYGAKATTPSFDEWMSQTAQVNDLGQQWAAVNAQLGLTMGQPQVAMA